MASISNLTLSVLQDVANAEINVAFDVNWTTLDQVTNLQYLQRVQLFGDDTGQDLDDQAAGDDPISLGLVALPLISSNGQAVTHRTWTKTIPFSDLNEDLIGAGTVGDDEIRAVVTLTPMLPATVSRESNLVTVNA